MEQTIKINDYEVILTPVARKIEEYNLLLRNINKMGIKSELEQFVTSSYQFGLPYSHNINVTHKGEIEIIIFEKNHKKLKEPERILFGQIKDFKLKE